MTDFDPDTETQPAVIKFEGNPTNPQSEKESTRWRRFLNLIRLWGTRAGLVAEDAYSLADEFGKAEIAKKNAEAEKIAAEAAEITAASDSKRQETVITVNDEIQRIFSDNETPELAKRLQLTNLLSANPELAAQLEKIEEISDMLKIQHGTRVEFQQPEDTSSDAEIRD